MQAIRAGATVEQVHDATKIDPWFVDQLFLIDEVARRSPDGRLLLAGAAAGEAARLLRRPDRKHPRPQGVRGPGARPPPACGRCSRPSTPARRSSRQTPYHYSSYDERPRSLPRRGQAAVIILGSGPNRIGQGIEFDYSCVHASPRCRGGGYETDHGQLQPGDGLDRLRHLRPALLRAADPRGRGDLEVVTPSAAGPVAGVICQPRRPDAARLAQALKDAGVPSSAPARGDPPRRGARGPSAGCWPRRGCRAQARHGDVVRRTPRRSPPRSATWCWCGRRTSWAGAAWRSSTTTTRSRVTSRRATEISPDRPVLVDRFIDDAVEIDVDALYDGEELFLGGGWSTSRRPASTRRLLLRAPPITLGDAEIQRIREATSSDRPRASGAGCSTSSSRWAPTSSTSSRPTRGPAAPSRSSPRRPRHPAGQGRGPGDDGESIAELRASGACCPPRATGARCPPTSRSRSRRR